MVEPAVSWQWDVPQRLNIGVACSDSHLGTRVAQRVAMIVEDSELGTSQITYAELAALTSRFAEVLRSLGVRPGDRVLMRLPNSTAYPVVFLGTMKCGAISVPVSNLLTSSEIEYMAHDCCARILLVDKAFWAAQGTRLARLASLEHVLLLGDGDVVECGGPAVHALAASMSAVQRCSAAHPTASHDPAYLVYTSGTTGHPKGVLHAHRSLIGRGPAATHWFDFRGEEDRILHSGKLNWTFVLGSALMDPLSRGKTVILFEGKSDAWTWPRLIAEHRATLFLGVPTVFRQIVEKTDCGTADVPSLRQCLSAGEYLSDAVLTQWRRRFGMDIHEAVGMSEISYYLSHHPSRAIRPGTAGFAQPGHAVKLLDPRTMSEVAPGEDGMICVPHDDPALFMAYWNRPEETARAVHDGWFFTGDYARRDSDGCFMLLGRKDEIINSFGYRISPFEVERVLKSHPDVAECACIGERVGPDKTLVAVHIVLQPGSRITAQELQRYGSQHLASYKAPKAVYIVAALPRTSNGKLIRSGIGASAACRDSLPGARG